MNDIAILKAGTFPTSINDALESEFDVVELPANAAQMRDVLTRRGAEIKGIAVRSVPITAACLERLPKLEVISSYGAGVNNVDVAYAESKGVKIRTTSSVLAGDVADLALVMALNLVRRIPQSDDYIRGGKWRGGKPVALAHSLSEMTLGIVGLGSIGKEIARRMEAICKEVVYFGPHKKEVEWTYYDDLERMAGAVQILMLACPLNRGTTHLVDAGILRALGADSYLINVARGAVVDEAALVTALDGNLIAGAALDVFEHEPAVPDALLKHDNVLLTPHIGSGTVETRRKMGETMVRNLKEALA